MILDRWKIARAVQSLSFFKAGEDCIKDPRGLLALCLVLLACGFAPAAWADDADPSLTHPVWTLVPTHIDRDKEKHERLAPRPEEDVGDLIITPDHPIRIGPEGTFNVEGKPTQIFGMVLPDRQTLCTTPTGARWACGVRAIATFVSLLAEHKLSCDRVSPIGTTVTVVTCRAGNADVAERMIGDGWAIADERASVKLKSIEDAARKDLRGRWRTTIPDL